MESVTECPICNQQSFEPYLSCKDYTVSHETFNLIKCKTCDFVITSPRPVASTLGNYYLSEDYISHSPKSKTIINKLYKISRLLTLRWKVKIIKTSKPSSILDYGCGTGEFLSTCEKHGLVIQGVEPSPVARTHANELTHNKVVESIDNIQSKFDVITMWHVLEHVPDLNGTIEKLKARLTQNGTMFIAVPNRESNDAQKYKEHWAGYDVPRHLWHFNHHNMKQLLSKNGLTLKNKIPMKLDAFYVSMLSEKYANNKSGLPQLIKGAINGLSSNISASKSKQYSSIIYVAQ